MEDSNWKSKLTDKQLEKKRWLDRRNRRKTRQNSKQTVAELEMQVDMLLSGDQGILIDKLREENARLRERLSQYQSKVESLVLAGRELLESDEMLDVKVDSLPIDAKAADINAAIHAPPSGPFLTVKSLVCEIFEFSRDSPKNQQGPSVSTPSTTISDQELTKAVMAWKLFSGQEKSGYEVLIERFALDKSPFSLAQNRVEQLIYLENMYELVLESLFTGDDLLANQPNESDKDDRPSGSEMERQKRAVALCAYESVRTSRQYFKTKAEYITMFWAQYRYYLFLVFPTAENLSKCPSWHRPRASQIMNTHPSFVDFLVWPALRDELVKSWDKYDVARLMIDLIKNFTMRSIANGTRPLIRLAANESDLQLDESFEIAIQTLDSYSTLTPFLKQYPELAPLVTGSPPSIAAGPSTTFEGHASRIRTSTNVRSNSDRPDTVCGLSGNEPASRRNRLHTIALSAFSGRDTPTGLSAHDNTCHAPASGAGSEPESRRDDRRNEQSSQFNPQIHKFPRIPSNYAALPMAMPFTDQGLHADIPNNVRSDTTWAAFSPAPNGIEQLMEYPPNFALDHFTLHPDVMSTSVPLFNNSLHNMDGPG